MAICKVLVLVVLNGILLHSGIDGFQNISGISDNITFKRDQTIRQDSDAFSDEKEIFITLEGSGFQNPTVIFIFLLALTIAIYAFFQFKTLSLRRSNRILKGRDIIAREVHRQKELISIRNKNIEDSLRYAQRIQLALFTNPQTFKNILPHSFILHEPRDLVSGDFYWIFEMNDKIFLTAVDCTGHGVPGAFMSIIGFELFRKIIVNQQITEPAAILNHVNKNFEEIFGSDKGNFIMRDGMDLAFCVINKKTNLLEYAGAFNPVYIIRQNRLIEIKASRFSVGVDNTSLDEGPKIFTSHKFQMEKNDMLYLFTDGFPDQFGGPEGKKFKYRRFRHLLLTIHELHPDKQKQYLNDSFEEWRGNYEQVDDILVIGVRPYFNQGHSQATSSSSG